MVGMESHFNKEGFKSLKLLKLSGNMQSSTSSSKKPTERERLDKVVLQSRHRKSYQNRGGNKTPEKSAALIQAKLEYLEI